MTAKLARVVSRAAARLRLLPVIEGVADTVLSVPFDPADAKATTAAITALAHAVEDEHPRALVRLPLPVAVAYAGQDREGRVRVLQMYNMLPKDGPPRMETMMYAGIAR